MYWAPVPEATVHKDCNLDSNKRQIRPSPKQQRVIHAKPQPASVEFRPKGQLRPRVAPTVCTHTGLGSRRRCSRHRARLSLSPVNRFPLRPIPKRPRHWYHGSRQPCPSSVLIRSPTAPMSNMALKARTNGLPKPYRNSISNEPSKPIEVNRFLLFYEPVGPRKRLKHCSFT